MAAQEYSPPTYLAQDAFETLRYAGSGITYDLEQVVGIRDLLKEELDMSLPDDPDNLTFIYRAVGGLTLLGPKPDDPYFKARYSERYTPSGQLRLPPETANIETVTKAAIRDQDRTVFEINIRAAHEPLSLAFARTLSYPPAEDAGLIASAAAWRNHAKELVPGRNAKRNKVLTKVGEQFMGAIVLQPR